MVSLLLHIICVLAAVQGFVAAASGVDDVERLILTSHSKAAQDTEGGWIHILNIFKIHLQPANFNYTGLFDNELLISHDMLLGHRIVPYDILLHVTTQAKIQLHIACESMIDEEMVLEPKKNQQEEQHQFFCIPRYILESMSTVGGDCIITVMSTSNLILDAGIARLIIDYIPANLEEQSGQFGERFHANLFNGVIQKQYQKVVQHKMHGLDVTPSHSSGHRLRHKRHQLTSGLCQLTEHDINVTELEARLQTVYGHQISVNTFNHQGIVRFSTCGGFCPNIQSFSSGSDHGSPLANQSTHDLYWMMALKLQGLGLLLNGGPVASCIGYNYTFDHVIYSHPDRVQQQLIWFPTQCACV